MVNLQSVENKAFTASGKLDSFSNNIAIGRREDILVDYYVLIDQPRIMRLDTIVERYYGTNDLLDVICQFNHLLSPFEVNDGMVIALPNITSLENSITIQNVKYLAIMSKAKAYQTFLNLVPSSPAKMNAKVLYDIIGSNIAANTNKTYSKSSNGVMVF